MGLNSTPSGERVHIGFFGRTNAGKSSVVNAVTNQEIAVVSDVQGTTTDPVYKAMELLPLGPVMIIDTAGIDDDGALGKLRISKTMQVLNKTDIAVLVVDSVEEITDAERDLIHRFEQKNIDYIVVYNKSDLVEEKDDDKFYVSTKTGQGITELKEKIASFKPQENPRRLVADFVSQGDRIVLVTPIDASAPKGRLILPQQQAIRDILDSGATAIVCQPSELADTLESFKTPPKFVITDSQVFGIVDKITPKQIPLTSFSILMARYKGFSDFALRGVEAIDKLNDGDKVLIAEGCTHHRQCEDIGTVKLPNMLKKHTGKDIKFEFTSGTQFPDDLTQYALVIHCGGCMINEREIRYRMQCCEDQGVPVTNYGIALAHMNGILKRSIEIIK